MAMNRHTPSHALYYLVMGGIIIAIMSLIEWIKSLLP